MNTIFLTKYADALVPSTDTKNLNDSDELLPLPGAHFHLNEETNGSFCIFTVSPRWRRMTCRMCNLAVEFPTSVKTYGELRKYFAQQLKPLN